MWAPEKVRQLYKTDTFHHGIFDPDAFTVQPLALVLGLAGAAEDQGTLIFEHTKATKLEKIAAKEGSRRWQVRTHTAHTHTHFRDPPHTVSAASAQVCLRTQVVTEGGAKVRASDVVLAGSGHLPDSLDGQVARAVVPCVSYIMVTEPLGERLKEAVAAPYGAFDDRFALNYFRPLPGGRLLWGGKHHIDSTFSRNLSMSHANAPLSQGFFQTYPISDERLKEVMLKDMLRVFPQLAGAKADFVRAQLHVHTHTHDQCVYTSSAAQCPHHYTRHYMANQCFACTDTL